jgi:hypothetical protein
VEEGEKGRDKKGKEKENPVLIEGEFYRMFPFTQYNYIKPFIISEIEK